MKKFLLILVILIVVGAGAFFAFMRYTKSFSPQIEVKAKNANISVLYCQPAKKNREIFGGLVPYGKVWRTGANEATTISFEKNMEIDGKTLPAGKYSIWTVPNEKTWEVIFNSQIGQWGTQYDSTKDVLRANAQVEKTNEGVEKFEIRFEESENIVLEMRWDNTLVKLPLKVQ